MPVFVSLQVSSIEGFSLLPTPTSSKPTTGTKYLQAVGQAAQILGGPNPRGMGILSGG
jgi:hypothetical protein